MLLYVFFLFIALHLKEQYPKAQGLVDDFFKPIVEVDREKAPNLHFERTIGDNIWKARLQLQWPHVIKISGSHLTEEKAKENAYLQACDILKVTC